MKHQVIAFNEVILMWLFRIWLSFVCRVLSYDSKLMEKNNTQIDCTLLSDDVIIIMTSSLSNKVQYCVIRCCFSNLHSKRPRYDDDDAT